MAMFLPMAFALAAPVLAWDLDDPHVSVGPPPDWVEPLEPPVGTPAPVGMALESAQYLLVDDQVRIGTDQAQRYAHTTYRIVTREGLDGLSRLEVGFDPAWAVVRVHHLRVWRDQAWHDRLEGTHATVIREESSLWQHIFDGTRKLVVVMPDVRVGDIVDVAWSVDGLDPVFDQHYGEGWPMAWGVPTERRQLRLAWSPERSLQLRGFGVESPSTGALDDGWSEARWDLSHRLPVVEEYELPLGYNPYAWVQASDFEDWADVVDWSERVYALPGPAHPQVQALADQLWAQTGETGAFLLAVTRWVQDEVRYFGMEVGDASHVPHSPPLVLQRRYGDCKDKSLLLIALLRARGLEAWPALVSRQHQESIGTMLPSPTVFDHVVVVARVGERELWLDATENDQGGSLEDGWIPAFGKALVVAPGIRGLSDVPLPTLPMGRATVRHVYDLQDDPDQPDLMVETSFEGHRAEEMRRMLADIRLTRLQEDFLDHYAQLGVLVRPSAQLSIRDDRDANLLELREHYSMGDAWQILKPGVEELWLPPASIFDWLPVPSGPRRYPLSLPIGLDEHEQISVRTDPSWDLESIDAKVENPWFVFEASTVLEEGSVDLTYRLRVLRDRVTPDEVAGYQAAVQEVQELRGYALQRGETGWQVPWDLIENILAFLVAIFAVAVAVPVSVFAAGVLVWLGLPRRALERR